MVITVGILGEFVALLGLVIGGLSLAGAPAYLFEDLLGLSEPIAYGLGAGMWGVATVIVVRHPEFDSLAMVLLHRFSGVTIENPLTIAGGILTAFYLLAAVGFALEDGDRS